MENNTCLFCHTVRIRNNEKEGKTLIRYSNKFQKVSTRIRNPECNNPKLQSSIKRGRHWERIFSMDLKYCPECGRKLGRS